MRPPAVTSNPREHDARQEALRTQAFGTCHARCAPSQRLGFLAITLGQRGHRAKERRVDDEARILGGRARCVQRLALFDQTVEVPFEQPNPRTRTT